LRDREIKFIIISLILASIIGGFLGQLIGEYLPDGAVKTLFMRSMDIGIGQRGLTANTIQEPISINLFSIALTFGLIIKINFVSLLMVILVIIYFKWWYL
jgi:hypothetical protein